MTALLLALALAAWGQEVELPHAPAPTAPSVELSSAPPPEVEKPEAAALPRSRVVVHNDAADWEPISVRMGEAPAARTSFERRLRRRGAGYKGEPSPATSAARSYLVRDDRWLVVSVYPQSLRYKRTHLEVRFFIQEGYLEKVLVSAVSVVGGQWSAADEQEDSFTLSAKGADYIEQSPGSGEVSLSVIDPGPGRQAVNAGRLTHAAFGDKDLGFVNLSWSSTGAAGAKKPARP